VLGFLGIGKAVESATIFHDLTSLAQRVQRISVYAVLDQIASSKRDSFFAKESLLQGPNFDPLRVPC
jgi:hypothetical protein